MSMTYTETTGSLRVDVVPDYLEDESKPREDFYVWRYLVTITNEGNETVQLIDRHWEITDGTGLKQVVDGPGVIGQQPVIAPGGHHRYASWTWLPTPTGFMMGHYGMEHEDGSRFQLKVPAFSLDSPAMLKRAN